MSVVSLFELTIDGNLLTVIEKMIFQRVTESVRFSKVKGHADDDMVAVGRVRVEDKVGNDFADRAADFGRSRVSDLVVDVRRRFVSACSLWYSLLSWICIVSSLPLLVLQSTRMDVLGLRSGGGVAERRKVRVSRVSAWEFAWVPGPAGLWRHGCPHWVGLVLRLVVLMLVFGSRSPTHKSRSAVTF